MPKFEHEYISQYPLELIYDLIIDVEKYPDFIPWCANAEVIEKHRTFFIADLFINYKLLAEVYRSKVELNAPYKGNAVIKVALVSGPFQKLNNVWQLEKVENNKTRINFSIDFEFKSVLLDKMVGLVFGKACEKIINAFEDRAAELYKKSYGCEHIT